jgi:hypothetical protein
MTLLPVTSYAIHTVQGTPGQQTVLLGSGLLLPLWLNTGPQREAALAAHAPAPQVICTVLLPEWDPLDVTQWKDCSRVWVPDSVLILIQS